MLLFSDLLSLALMTTFCYFVPFWEPTLSSSSVLTGHFFFKSELGFRPRSMGICGGGGATWDLGVVFDVNSLPLAAMRFLKLLLPLFNTILSSSSSKSFGRASIKYRLWILELLSDSLSASKMQIKGALGLFSSSKWNLSISSSSDRQDEATPFTSIAAASIWAYRSKIATSRGFCSTGRGTRRRSLRAKNPGLKTSIRANLELPAIVAWPTSWKVWDRGS